MGKNSLQVYCWNIQTNNARLIEAHKTQIANAMIRRSDLPGYHGFNPTSPWVLAILENKSGGEAVGNTLRTALGGEWSRVVDMGGSPHTHENIVLVGGGGCSLEEAGPLTTWRDSFDMRQETNYENAVATARKHDEERRSSLREAARKSPFGSRGEIVERQTPKYANDCRNPVLMTVNVPGVQAFKLGFLHAPGPSEKSQYGLKAPDSPWTEKLAGAYVEEVFTAFNAAQVHAVLGDYNLYEDGPTMEHMIWFSKDLGPTTCYKGSGEGVPKGGKLDRVYAKPEMCVERNARKVANFGEDLSDHAGVGVLLGPRGSAQKRKREDSDGADAPDPKRAKVAVDADPVQMDVPVGVATTGTASSSSGSSEN